MSMIKKQFKILKEILYLFICSLSALKNNNNGIVRDDSNEIVHA